MKITEEFKEEKLLLATSLLKQSLETMEMPKALQGAIPNHLLQQMASQNTFAWKLQNWGQELSLNKLGAWSGLGFCAVMFFSLFVLQKEAVFNQHVNGNNQVVHAQEELEKVPFIILDEVAFLMQQNNLKIISSEVPNRILATTGISINPQHLAGYSHVELLVGNDEELIAVRFIAE